MSTKLKRFVEALAVAALWVAALAALPGTAEAQEMSSTGAARGTDRVVVAPGDSLWSISQERLGPQATPQRVDREVERIYALNRDRIGPDPNLIFVGQELVLPPTAEHPALEPASAKASAKASHSREAPEAAQAGLKDRAATEGEDKQTSRPVAVSERKKAPERVAGERNLPDNAEVPAVRPLASDASSTDKPGKPAASLLWRSARSLLQSGTSAVAETLTEARTSVDERRMLGKAILALTVLVAALIAWSLPMRRTTRSDAERWGMPTGYEALGHNTRGDEETASKPVSPPAFYAGTGERPGERREWRRTGDATGYVNTSKRRRAGPARVLNGGSSPSGGLALGAHDARVRRAVLQGRTPMRARMARAPSSGAARKSGPLLRLVALSRPNERGAEQR